MKKLLKIFLSLLLLMILFVGIWLGVNLWPRKMEPPLWTEAELAIPEDKALNGYSLLVPMKENPVLKSKALEIPETLESLIILKWPETPTDRILFWAEAKKLEPTLSSFIRDHQEALQEYQKLLDAPQFIDQDPISIEPKGAPWLTLLDLHKIGGLSVTQKILEGDSNTAFSIWLKMFQMDQSWLHSTRGVISHMAAIRTLEQDLILLLLLRNFPPSEGGEKIVQALQNFDPEKIDYRRALISEYLFHLTAVNAIVSEYSQKTNRLGKLWIKAIFNQAVFRREVNDRFRRLEPLLKDPQAITDETANHFVQEVKNLRKGWFWWFHNPLGKILEQLLFVNPVDNIRNFYGGKDEIRKIRSQLLAQPLFPPIPETLPTETQAMETQPSPETESKPDETKE